MKIEELTPEQESLLAVYRDKWIDIGLSTDPANKQEAENAINESYRHAGLPRPQKIVWCGSPLSQGLMGTIITDKEFVNNSVRKLVRNSVWDSVTNSVRDSVRDSVRKLVWDSLMRDSSVWDSFVWDSSVRDSVRASVWDSVRDSVWASAYGQHDASWLGFYEYFRDVVGLTEETEKLTGLIAQAKHAGWFLPCRNICWVSERHNFLSIDDGGRLHNLTGPALTYPDGWSIYAIRGTRIPAEWIDDKPPCAADLLKWKNIEQRRAGCELIGWASILDQLQAIIIDNDNDPMIGTLYEAVLPDSGRERFLKVKCGTGRDFVIPVDPSCSTALEANSWSYGLDQYTFNPEIRT